MATPGLSGAVVTLATFPVLPGQSITVHKKPRWSTVVGAHASGREARFRHYQWPMWDFELMYDGLDATATGRYGGIGALTLHELAGFFNQRQGAYQPFLYVDPTDFTVVGQAIGVGDGSTTAFTMVRSIGPFTGPVDDVTAVAAIYLDGIAQASGWTVYNGYPYPALVFTTAPGSNVKITADFSYAYIVRFSDDVLDFEEFLTRLFTVRSVKMQSVRLDTGAAASPVVPALPTGPLLVLYDECCHMYTSGDLGVTWQEQITPGSTGADVWGDLTMALNDADYDAIVGYDFYVASFEVPAVFSGMQGAVQIASLKAANLNTAPVINPAPAIPNYTAFSGASSAGGRTILVAPTNNGTSTSTAQYPMITRDAGATWVGVTTLPVSYYLTAAFNAGASIMYIHEVSVGVHKSTDGGATWTLLSGSPAFGEVGGGVAQQIIRLRCDKTGAIVAAISFFGNFWLSVNGGATWTHTDFKALAGLSSFQQIYADFGMTPDGSKFFVVLGVQINSGGIGVTHAWSSTDGGATFAALSPPPPQAASYLAYVCNIAPDGQGLLIGYETNPSHPAAATIGAADISTDSGATWSGVTFPLSQMGGGETGLWVSCFYLPPSP